MTYTISKDFEFSASHQLNGLHPHHQCARLHGHNYVARVSLVAGSLDATGFILDYGELQPFKLWIDRNLDHRHLNDVLGGINPTAENLATYLHDVLSEVIDIPDGVLTVMAISETPKTWASYMP